MFKPDEMESQLSEVEIRDPPLRSYLPLIHGVTGKIIFSKCHWDLSINHTPAHAPCPGVVGQHKKDSVFCFCVILFCLFIFALLIFSLFWFSFFFFVCILYRKRERKQEGGWTSRWRGPERSYRREKTWSKCMENKYNIIKPIVII